MIDRMESVQFLLLDAQFLGHDRLEDQFEDGFEEIGMAWAKPLKGKVGTSNKRPQHPAHLASDETKDGQPAIKDAPHGTA